MPPRRVAIPWRHHPRPEPAPRLRVEIGARFDGPGLQSPGPASARRGPSRRPPGERLVPRLLHRGRLCRARWLARAGARRDPPAETGAALFGPLCGCPAHRRSLQRRLRKRCPWRRRKQVLVIAWPGPAPPGEGSRRPPKRRETPGREAWRSWDRATATTSSSPASRLRGVRHPVLFVSDDDARGIWVVFHRQPWHLCHIFSPPARGEPVDRSRWEGPVPPPVCFDRMWKFPPYRRPYSLTPDHAPPKAAGAP